LLIGFLSRVNDIQIARQGKILLLSYGFGIIFVNTLSSQTRHAITALILLIVSISFYKKYKMKLFKALGIIFIALFIVLAIQAQRMLLKQDLMYSSNQLTTALENIFSGTFNIVSESNSNNEVIISRAQGSVVFLSDIIDSFNKGYSPLYGKGILIGLIGIIPRSIYPEKPIIISPQLVVKGLLDMPLIDDTLTMINQFYVEFGTFGLLLWFAIFGYLFGKYFNYLMSKNSIAPFIFFSFFISQVIQMEHEFILGLLGVLRNSIIIYFLFVTFRFIYGFQKTNLSSKHAKIGSI
jgi:hypothetical protein